MLLIKKTLRTMGRYKAQFISMAVMLLIASGIFLGLHMEWRSIEKTVTAFFEQTGFADYRLYEKRGFSTNDLRAVESIEGVSAASRLLSVNTTLKGTDKTLNLNVVEKYGTPSLYITEGAPYDPQSEGIYLSDRFAKANGIGIGDQLTLSYGLLSLKGDVVALVKCGEQLICVADSNQMMPNYTNHGFAYITPHKLHALMGVDYYPQINVRSSLERAAFESRLQEALGREVTTLDRKENLSYAGMQSEMEEGQTMASVLPALFLLIAGLTMMTTMHRIALNEKTQIGILKALGFRNRRILLHYTFFALPVCLAGMLPGLGLGHLMVRTIIGPDTAMAVYMDVPRWEIAMPAFCLPVMAGMALMMILISYLSVRRVLGGTASETLAPYTPPPMRRLRVESLPLLDRLDFITRWNVRDTLRHKARSLMTLMGVIGCMTMLVSSLGMQDTMSEFLRMLNVETNRYTSRINLAENTSVQDAQKLAQRYEGDWMAEMPIRLNNGTVSLNILHAPHDLVRVLAQDGRSITLPEEGAYICIRLYDEGIRPGDTIEIAPYGNSRRYPVKVAGVFRSIISKSVMMSKAAAEKAGIPIKPVSVFTDMDKENIAPDKLINDVQSKKALMESFDRLMEVMNAMVAAIALVAVCMAVAVLYNLGVMSRVERSRELATLKVVGFRDRRLSRLLISQNLWLTVLGVLVGLPLGAAALRYLLKMMASEYELKITMGALTYLGSILLTLLTSLAVSCLVARSLRRIDMVEALKGVE